MSTKCHATKKQLTFIDLFAGLGGFHLAMHGLGIKCVFASEWDKHARKTYEHNFRRVSPELFSEGRFAGDIIQVPSSEIPDFDILAAGFPCQPFSIAGLRKGFRDARGTLFFEIVRIIRDKRPKAFFLENVKHLRSHNGGKTFETMKKIIESLGYSFHWKILRACDFGLPQYRPRLFMVGFRDRETPFKFPEPIPLKKTMSDILGGKCDKDIGRTLLASGYGGKIGQKMNCTEYFVDGVPRHLSVEEAKELMGLPKGFEFPVSAPQAFKQMGNGVAIRAVRAVARAVKKALQPRYKN